MDDLSVLNIPDFAARYIMMEMEMNKWYQSINQFAESISPEWNGMVWYRICPKVIHERKKTNKEKKS